MRIPYIDSVTVLPEIVTPETDLLPEIDPMDMPCPPVQWLFSKRRLEPYGALHVTQANTVCV